MKKVSLILLFCFVGFLSFTIKAQAQNCTYSISPTAINVPAGGGNNSFNITTGSGCPWTAVSNAAWINIQSTNGDGSGSISFSVQPNTSLARTGTITVAGRTFTVNQATNCSFSLSPGAGSFTASGGAGSFTVNTGADCTWTAASNNSWVTISSGSNGTGSGTVNYSVAANNELARTGTISVANQTFQITQSSNCTYSLSATSASFSADGGTGNFNVSAPAGCIWNATVEFASWITLTNAGGSGNGTVSFTVFRNEAVGRNGTIKIANQSFTVNQANGCRVGIIVTSFNLPSSGGSRSATAGVFGLGCSLQFTNSNSWFRVGFASGTLFIDAEPNNGAARTGTFILFAFGNPDSVITMTVNQAGQQGCTYSISPTNLAVPHTGGNYSLNIITQPECSWTTQFDGSLDGRPVNLTFTSPTSGTGSGKVDFTVAAAPTQSGRGGRIILSGNGVGVGSLVITQDGNCGELFVNPLNVNVPREGAANVAFNFSPGAAGCGITTQINDSWITPNNTGGYSVAPNAGAARTGTITIHYKYLNSSFIQKTATFTVNQAGQLNCTYALSPTFLIVPYTGGNYSLDIFTQPGCAWTAQFTTGTNTAPMGLTFTSPQNGTGSGKIDYAISLNANIADRALGGIINVNGQTQTLIQDRNCGELVVNPLSVNVPKEGASQASFFAMEGAEGCTIGVQSDASWIATSGPITNRTVFYSVSPNEGAARTGAISVLLRSDLGLIQKETKFTINQASGQTNCTYSLNPTGFQISSSGGNASFGITTETGCAWNAASNTPWINFTNASGSGSGNVGFVVQANAGVARTGTITVGGQTFTVNQSAACSYSITPLNATSGASGGNVAFQVNTTTDCSWSAVSSVDWITITSGIGTGNGTVLFSIQPNVGAARAGTIITAGQTFTVSQSAGVTADLILASGRVITPNFRSIRGALVTFTDSVTGETKTTITSQFGYFHFRNAERGRQYRVTISHKRYKFSAASTVVYNTSGLIQIFTSDSD